MNGRWVLAGIAFGTLALYVLSYVCLSLNGIYRPGAIGGNGIKNWEWSPAGYVDGDYKPRKVVFNAFAPLWILDRNYWHIENHALNENRDGHINFRGRIIDAEIIGKPP